MVLKLSPHNLEQPLTECSDNLTFSTSSSTEYNLQGQPVPNPFFLLPLPPQGKPQISPLPLVSGLHTAFDQIWELPSEIAGFFKDSLLSCSFMCISIMCMSRYPQRPEEGIIFLGAGVTGYCVPLIWLLGTKRWSSGKAGGALNCRASCSALSVHSEIRAPQRLL